MSTRRPVALITNNHHRACWRMAHRCNRRLTSPWRHCWRARIHDRPANRRHSSSKLTAGTTHRESRPFSRQVGARRVRDDDEAACMVSVRPRNTHYLTNWLPIRRRPCMYVAMYLLYIPDERRTECFCWSLRWDASVTVWALAQCRKWGFVYAKSPIMADCAVPKQWVFLYRLNEWNRK